MDNLLPLLIEFEVFNQDDLPLHQRQQPLHHLWLQQVLAMTYHPVYFDKILVR